MSCDLQYNSSIHVYIYECLGFCRAQPKVCLSRTALFHETHSDDVMCMTRGLVFGHFDCITHTRLYNQQGALNDDDRQINERIEPREKEANNLIKHTCLFLVCV